MARRTQRTPRNLKRYLVDVAYSTDRSKLCVHLFSRNEKLEFIEDIVYGFPPYCYVRYRANKLIESGIREKKLNIPVKFTPGYQAESEHVYKLEAKIPRHISLLRRWLWRREYRDIWEGDIEYKIRYIVDKGIKTGYELVDNEPVPVDFTVPERICFLDLEVFSKKVASYLYPEAPVIIIGIYDSYLSKYFIFVARKLKLDVNKLKKYLKSEPREIELILADSEKELFVLFSKKLIELNPDLIVTFTKYDLRYLIRRMYKTNFNPRALSRIGTAFITLPPKDEATGLYKPEPGKRYGEIIIKGRGFLDLQFGYRVLEGKVVRWESLEAIAQRELGYGKLKIGSVYDSWLSNPAFTVAYNLRDVELIKELDKKKGIIEYFIDLKNLVGCPVEYTYRTTSRTDILYLRKCLNKFILPNRKIVYPWGKWSYKGAIVLKPVPGVYDFILVLDFTAQYPNVIRTWNISFETFSPDGDLIIDELHRFKSTPKGIAVEIMEDFIARREAIDKEIKKAYRAKNYELVKKLKIKRRAIKTCMEGTYGLYGAKGNPDKKIKAFRLFHPRIAEAIPIPARILVEETLKICRENSIQVIYGDTDSVFINLKATGKKEAIKEAIKLKDLVQSKLSKFMNERWNLEESKVAIGVDKIFSRFIQLPVKKRYAGLVYYDKGELLEREEEEYKGIELVRADTARITENMLQNLARMILHKEETKLIINYLASLFNDIKSGRYSWLDLGIPTRMTKLKYKGNPVQKRSSDYSNRFLGTSIAPGERFYRIWVAKVPRGYVETDTIAYKVNTSIPEGFVIDYDRMAYDLVAKKSKELLKLIGINPGELFPRKEKKRRRRRKKTPYVTLDKYLNLLDAK